MTTTTHRYYVIYPRDFANEYTVYAVPIDKAAAFEHAHRDAEEIDREHAWTLGSQRPEEYRAAGQQHYGRWASSEPIPGDTDPVWHDDDGIWEPEPESLLPTMPHGWKIERGEDGWWWVWPDTESGRHVAEQGDCIGVCVLRGVVYAGVAAGGSPDATGPWDGHRELLDGLWSGFDQLSPRTEGCPDEKARLIPRAVSRRT